MEYYSSLDASQLDSETPTLFELISANQLEALLSPSLRYVLVYYAAKYPKYLLQLANKFEELNLALRVALEWYFIRFWQGLFTENFYGLKRVRKTRLSQNSARLTQLIPSKIEERRSLTNLQQAISVFEVAGTGYLTEKLGYCYERWYPKYITRQLKPTDPNSKLDVYRVEFKKKFVEWYPWVQSSLRAANFVTMLLYLSGDSKSPSLLTYLFHMNYSRLNQYDYDKNDPEKLSKRIGGRDKTKPNKIAPPTNIEYLLRIITRNFTKPSWKLIKLVLGTFFPIAIFSLKFLEWWNNSDFTQKIAKNLGNLLEFMLPPPSTLTRVSELEKEKKTHKTYKSGKLCPLCKEEITNPAIIETGYVFCYSCIYNHLAQSHKITRKRDNELDSEDENDDEKKNEKEVHERKELTEIKGGRCPITGKRLLGCKWNSLKEEWDVEGIRRLIF